MLIIEGSDCLGKTTLANNILKRVQELGEIATIRHLGRPDTTFDFYTDYFPMIEPSVIQDRFHLGALAYHDGVMTPDHLRIIEGWIYSHGGFIILMYASDFRKYRKRIENDPRGNLLEVPILEEANKRFYELVHCNKKAIIDFSWDMYDFKSEEQYIGQYTINELTEQWLQRRKEYYNGLEILQNSDR